MERDKRPRNREENEKVSRTLSAILRHKATELGLEIDAAGFVKLDDVIGYLKGKGFKNIDASTIQKVVDTNDKKRFEIQEKGHTLYIRATQGHSIKEVETEELLTKIVDPTLYPYIIHGTYNRFWALIKKDGLKTMKRNHIHFAPGMPKDNGVISGMRGSCDIYIEIDLEAAMKDGINFYISSNNVILTEGVNGVLHPKYFKAVINKIGNDLSEKKIE